MTTQQFPALGFDPAPGEPGALGAAAQSVDRVATSLGKDAATLSHLDSSTWVGEAAEAFRADLADLPRDLDHAARAHSETGRALSGYAETLSGMQRRAQELERRAEELKRQQAAAVAEVNRIAAIRLPSDDPRLADLRSQYSAARGRLDQAGGDLQQVIAAARQLRQDAHDAARSAARRIKGATDPPYKKPSWLSRAWDGVTGWIRDNADVLKKISGVLKAVAAVAGLLALIPGLQWLAPVALIAGGLALAIDVAVKLTTGEGSWGGIAFDALTMLPFGKLLKAGKALTGAVKGADALEGAIKGERALVGAERAVSAGERAVAGAERAAGEVDDVARGAKAAEGSAAKAATTAGEEAGGSRRIVRADNDFRAPTNERGIPKAHLADDGSLVPANPHGTTTPTEHVQGALNPAKKGNSPYTSFSPEGHVGKVYGDKQIAIEVDRLSGDIAAGKVRDIELLSPERVRASIQSDINNVAGRHIDVDLPHTATADEIKQFGKDLGLSAKVRGKLDPMVRAMLNTRRDQEWLVKGVVPPDYIIGPYPVAGP